MNASVTTTSSNPWRRRRSTMCSMHGLPTMGTIGFGWFDVSGRRRVPSPPAMTTAFTRSLSHGAPGRHRVQGRCDEREREARVEDPERPRGAVVPPDERRQPEVQDARGDLADHVHGERVAASTNDAVAEEERAVRSEEHTSELQSRQYLVCRLLLEKKKKKIK